MIVVNHEGVAAEWKAEVGDAQATLSVLRASESLGWCFLTAVLFSGVWLAFMRYCVTFAIYALFALCLALESLAAGGLFYLANGMHGWPGKWVMALGICVVLLLLYTSYVAWGLRHRVALATSMIDVAGGVLKRAPSLFAVSTTFALALLPWGVLCGASAWATFHDQEYAAGHAFGLGVLLCLVTYWGLAIIRNAALTSIYGTVGEWYYQDKIAVCAPMCRSVTSCLGSVAFGSLLVAAVQTLHDTLHALAQKGYIPAWVMCCIDRCLKMVEAAINYLNMYGFVQVAIHGDGFIAASRRAYQFLKYKGFTALINDSIVGRMQWVGAVTGGLLAGIAPILVLRWEHGAKLDNLHLDGHQESALLTAGFALGAFVVHTLISPVHAIVTALLVCFAEHPDVLAEKHRGAYELLIAPWEAVYGTDFVDKAATMAALSVDAPDGGPLVGGARKGTLVSDLEALSKMKAEGGLSESEFSEAKARLLD